MFNKLKYLFLPLISMVIALNNGYAAEDWSKKTSLLAPLSSKKMLHFTVHLKLRNREKFDALYHEIYNPNSGRYRQYLTKKEYKSEFAPTARNLSFIKKYFTRHGMKAEVAGDDIDVSATVAQIEKIFKIKMNYYLYEKKKIYSNASEPEFDPAIAPYILSVSGLSTRPRFHKMVLSVPRKQQTNANLNLHELNQKALENLTWDNFKPKALPTDTSLNGFTGEQLRTTYKLESIPPINGTIIDGSGQTIVILDEWGINDPTKIMEDANQFSALSNLPPLSLTATPGNPANFAVVRPDGVAYGPHDTEADQGWADEIALDIASAHTIAPKANIVLVLNNNLDISRIITTILNNGNGSFAGFANAYVLSNSWGGTEYHDATLETNLQLAAMSGLSVNFSSSDCGDGSYNSSWPCTTVNSPPRVEYPASSALATAIGGSSLFVDNNYNYSFESGWGSYYPNSGFYAGSTGGISQLYDAPTWQNNAEFQAFTAGGYGVIASYGGKRAVPDIGMLADIHTGIIAYYTHGCESGCIFGGTSVACPLYSGTLALINQARMAQNKLSIGLSAEFLYSLNQDLLRSQALNFITPPHQIISSTVPNPPNAPNDVFTLFDNSNWFTRDVSFNWDSSLTMSENQYWNDVVGVGSPNLPNFVPFMAGL